MRVVFHSGGVFILLGLLGGRGNQYCPIGQRAGMGGEGRGKGGAGEKKAGGGRGEAGGTWFFVPASGNRFSKYSGKMDFHR